MFTLRERDTFIRYLRKWIERIRAEATDLTNSNVLDRPMYLYAEFEGKVDSIIWVIGLFDELRDNCTERELSIIADIIEEEALIWEERSKDCDMIEVEDIDPEGDEFAPLLEEIVKIHSCKDSRTYSDLSHYFSEGRKTLDVVSDKIREKIKE